jgi:hypothetical protein
MLFSETFSNYIFQNLVLTQEIYLGNYFLTIKSLWKAANKLGDLNTIYNNSSGFPTWFLVNQNIQTP